MRSLTAGRTRAGTIRFSRQPFVIQQATSPIRIGRRARYRSILRRFFAPGFASASGDGTAPG
jgi:hypothetical protein